MARLRSGGARPPSPDFSAGAPGSTPRVPAPGPEVARGEARVQAGLGVHQERPGDGDRLAGLQPFDDRIGLPGPRAEADLDPVEHPGHPLDVDDPAGAGVDHGGLGDGEDLAARAIRRRPGGPATSRRTPRTPTHRDRRRPRDALGTTSRLAGRSPGPAARQRFLVLRAATGLDPDDLGMVGAGVQRSRFAPPGSAARPGASSGTALERLPGIGPRSRHSCAERIEGGGSRTSTTSRAAPSVEDSMERTFPRAGSEPSGGSGRDLGRLPGFEPGGLVDADLGPDRRPIGRDRDEPDRADLLRECQVADRLGPEAGQQDPIGRELHAGEDPARERPHVPLRSPDQGHLADRALARPAGEDAGVHRAEIPVSADTAPIEASRANGASQRSQ